MNRAIFLLAWLIPGWVNPLRRLPNHVMLQTFEDDVPWANPFSQAFLPRFLGQGTLDGGGTARGHTRIQRCKHGFLVGCTSTTLSCGIQFLNVVPSRYFADVLVLRDAFLKLCGV